MKNNFPITTKIFKKTLYSEIVPTNVEEIPSKIERILNKLLKNKVKVSGNGLTNNITIIYEK